MKRRLHSFDGMTTEDPAKHSVNSLTGNGKPITIPILSIPEPVFATSYFCFVTTFPEQLEHLCVVLKHIHVELSQWNGLKEPLGKQ